MKRRFPKNSSYKVMVQCITYNHSQFIEDTLNGFAIQQTNFPFVCCVYDDASTDGEQEVLKRWVDNHCNAEEVETYDHPLAIILMAADKDNPNCIYAIHLQKVNTWGKPEKRELMSHWEKQCEYIALCEGDDYWIDPLKLQKQVGVLDANPKLSSCWTGYISREKGKYDNVMTICAPSEDDVFSIYTLEDWVSCWFTKTPTSLFRLKSCDEYNEKFSKFIYARDIHLFYYLLKWGNAAYMHYASTIYNIHGGGICSMVSKYDNAVHSYNCYKELYLLEKNEVLRCKFLAAINKRLKYRKKGQNSLALMKEGLKLSNTLHEKIRIISIYLFCWWL